MAVKNPTNLKAIYYALLGYASFSVGDALLKYLRADYGVFDILFWTMSTSFVLLLVFSSKLGGLTNTVKTKKAKWHFLRSCTSVASSICAFYAFGLIPMVDAYTIIFAAPFISIVLSRLFFKEPIGFRALLVVLVGFLGVLIALRPGFVEIEFGHVAALCVATFFAATTLMSKNLGTSETKLSFLLYPVALGICVSLFMLDMQIPVIAYDKIPIILIMGILSPLGWYVLSMAFVYAPASSVAPCHYSQFIWGLVIGFVAFNEVPSVAVVMGAILIALSGLYLIQINKQNEQKEKIND